MLTVVSLCIYQKQNKIKKDELKYEKKTAQSKSNAKLNKKQEQIRNKVNKNNVLN